MAQAATWTRIAKNDAIQRSSLCVSSINNAVYVFGGELKARQPRDNDVHVISLTEGGANTKIIQANGNSPSARVGAATTTQNGKIYMFSGRGGEAMAPIDESGCIWVFDPSIGSWSSLEPSSSSRPEARSYHCMAGDGHDTIYLHAGCPEKGRLSDLWAFSISKSEWKQRASAPGPPRGGASIAFINDKLYRMNGFDGTTEQGGSLDVFDIKENSWQTISYSPDGKSGPGARSVSALIPIRIHGQWSLVTLFGESDPSSLGHQGAGKMLADVWAFSLDNQTWVQVNASADVRPVGRGWFDADVANVDGKDGVVVVGGLGETNDRVDDAWFLAFQR